MNLLDLIKGEHRATDAYRLALYLEQPGDSYDREREVKGVGYRPGGQVLSSPVYGQEGGDVWMTFTGDDLVWPGSTITARYAAIYNGRTKRILHIEPLGTVSSVNDRFTVSLPDKPLVKFRESA
jgi:hypothetical protein